MKHLMLVTLLSLAVLAVAFVLHPSTSASLTAELKLPSDAIKVLMPPLGSNVDLPAKDFFGRDIEHAEGRAVVAMPSCQSCSVRHINWATLKRLSTPPPGIGVPGSARTELSIAAFSGISNLD